MAFPCAVLLLVFWFVRPQDILPSLEGLNVVRYLMFFGIWVTVSRPGGLKAGHFVRTPVDFMMMGYLSWIVYTTPDHMDAFKEVFTYLAFYVVTVLALDSEVRIKKYITYWALCLLTVSLLSLSSQAGVEIVAGSNSLTTAFAGRLALNTWIFNNPNALGHATVALIPLAIAWYGMHKPTNNRMVMVGLIMAGGYCVLLTQSKGAYISGAVSLSALFLFRRPVWVQVVVVQVLLSTGLGVLTYLPRMETLSSKDQGIMGRMMVWQSAMWNLKDYPHGVGLKKFHGMIDVPELGEVEIATHGSYVRTGADLGYPGLFFYAGLFFFSYLTLRRRSFPRSSESFRVQGALAVLMASYAFSAWVVDLAYHADFILLMALFSAYHRVIVAPLEKVEFANPAQVAASGEAAEVKASDEPPKPTDTGLVAGWGRPAIYELLIIVGLVWLIVYAWDYQSTKFLPF